VPAMRIRNSYKFQNPGFKKGAKINKAILARDSFEKIKMFSYPLFSTTRITISRLVLFFWLGLRWFTIGFFTMISFSSLIRRTKSLVALVAGSSSRGTFFIVISSS